MEDLDVSIELTKPKGDAQGCMVMMTPLDKKTHHIGAFRAILNSFSHAYSGSALHVTDTDLICDGEALHPSSRREGDRQTFAMFICILVKLAESSETQI